jgi:hypothetical protein
MLLGLATEPNLFLLGLIALPNLNVIGYGCVLDPTAMNLVVKSDLAYFESNSDLVFKLDSIIVNLL